MLQLVRLDFAGGEVAAHDGLGSITYDSSTFTGIGELGSIETVSEDSGIRPQTVRLSLTGVDAALLSDLQTDDYHRRTAELWIAVFDEAMTLLGDPVAVWSGWMDSATIELDENTAAITLTCMDALANVAVPQPVLMTDEAQQRRHTGDLGLEFAPQAQRAVRLSWGGTAYNPNPGVGDPGGPPLPP